MIAKRKGQPSVGSGHVAHRVERKYFRNALGPMHHADLQGPNLFYLKLGKLTDRRIFLPLMGKKFLFSMKLLSAVVS